jgi:formamidopyrimidine-DNA glycosylase
MPELPEVQAVVSALSPALTGWTISGVDQRRRDIASLGQITRNSGKGRIEGVALAPLLTGRTVTAITRRAKRVVFHLDNGTAFYVHLGMTGRLTLDPTESRPHTHLIVMMSDVRCGMSDGGGPKSVEDPQVGRSRSESAHLTSDIQHLTSDAKPLTSLHFSDPRRFGKVVFLPTGRHEEGLGPEPLEISAGEFHGLLRGTKRPIKTALLDQRMIAGLGNIYVDESLHAAGIHPARKTRSVSTGEAARLLGEIQRILRLAISHKGSTLRDYRDADGNPGAFQALHVVYDREGQPCTTCRTPIRRIVQSGRSTHYCPSCQKRRRLVARD